MRTIIALAILLTATPTLAQERLAAVGLAGIEGLDTYAANLHGVFKDAYAPAVRLRAVVEPSFSAEYVVGLRQTGGAYSLFALQPATQIWNYAALELMKKGEIIVQNPDGSPGTAQAIRRLQNGMPRRPGAVALSRCEVAIKPALAQTLIDLWERMLTKVRPGEKLNTGLDGEITEFSMTLDGAPRIGFAWSPDLASEPGLLVATADAMNTYCRKPSAQQMAKLDKASQDLGERLSAGPGKAATSPRP